MLGARRLGGPAVGLPASTAPGATPGGTGPRSSAPTARCCTSPSGRCRPAPIRFLVKAPGLWAEHTCDAPMQQWTVANETYATALDDPDDALGRAYGVPTAMAFDLEWYATGGRGRRAGRLRPGRRRARPRRAAGRPAAPDGGRRPAAGTAGATALGAGRRAARVRPHRPAGAVRLPRRHDRRLGAHSGRLAVTGSSPSRDVSDAARGCGSAARAHGPRPAPTARPRRPRAA